MVLLRSQVQARSASVSSAATNAAGAVKRMRAGFSGRTRSVVGARLGRLGYSVPTGGGDSFSSFSFRGSISGDPVDRHDVGGYFPGDLLDRWGAIEAGRVPADAQDDLPRLLTEADIEQMEEDGLQDIFDRGTAELRSIENRLAQRIEMNEEDIAAAESVTGPARASAMRRAAEARRDIARAEADAEQERDENADNVRREREELRSTLLREQEAAQEAHDERLAELRAGLHDEIEQAVNRYYFHSSGDYEHESHDLG